MDKYVIAVDLGGTNTVIGAVGIDGNILNSNSFHTAKYEFVNDWVAEVGKWIKALPNNIEIIGLGIGAPNGNYYTGMIDFAPNLKWKGNIPIKELLEKETKLKTIITNDANAAAIGEMMYGGGKGIDNFLLITIGTGLGSGFIVNSKIMYGFNGYAGEIGHMNAAPNGRQCSCGLKGCLETYVSTRGIIETYNELNQSNHSVINPSKISVKDIYSLALNGDKHALQTIYITGTILGHNIARVITITAPEKIFLFGGIANMGKLLIEPTEEAMNSSLLSIFKNKIPIEISHLQDKNAALLGAAALVFNEKYQL